MTLPIATARSAALASSDPARLGAATLDRSGKDSPKSKSGRGRIAYTPGFEFTTAAREAFSAAVVAAVLAEHPNALDGGGAQ